MTWVRLDDSFAQHPKVMEAGPLAMAMQVAALCYCNRHLTDGFIPRSVAPTLLNLEEMPYRWKAVVDVLIGVGLWEQTKEGFLVHDYTKYQWTRAQVEAEKVANAERQQRWRDAHSNGVSNGALTDA